MSSVTEGVKRRSNAKTALFVLIPLLVIGGGVAGYLSYGSLPQVTHGSSSGTNANTNSKIVFSVTITKQQDKTANFVWLTQMAMKGQFWSASCYAFCAKGVTYTLDPTVITNGGHNFEQCKIFGAAGTGDGSTCTAADISSVIGLSESSTSPAAADNSGSGPCKTTSTANELESGGLTDVAGTVTTGAAGGTVTTTIAHTFTAAETDSNVQVACLQTELHSGSNPVIYAEGTFGPDSLASGNTLAITWSISRT